ncbi:MAG: DNA translocase FtsK 4TM domain-containing protein, partial [Armatimonadota bacterium]
MRKSRPHEARRNRSPRRRFRINPILIADIFGIALILACFVTYYTLFHASTSGVLGPHVAEVLKTLLGIGAYLAPALVGMIGIMMIIGPLEIIPRNIAIGSSILFVVVITWASLDALIENAKDPTVGGGYIGNAIAHMLSKPFGTTPAYAFLVAATAVAGLIIVDRPVASLAKRVRRSYTEWLEVAKKRREITSAHATRTVTQKTKAVESLETPPRKTLTELFRRKPSDEQITEELHRVDTPKQLEQIVSHRELGHQGMEPAEDKYQTHPDQESEFKLPPTSFLADPPPAPQRVESELKENIEIIERTLREFNVDATVVEISHGPTVARYEIRLAPGIRVNKIVGLADNLAMQLAAIDVRVEAPIPGKSAIGVEVPNKKRGTVVLKEVVESKQFREATSKLTFALGKDVAGRPVVADLARMPHLLIGGATNAGKSVCLNSLIASLLFRATPDELKFIMIDPKRVELSLFDGIPHLACPVVRNVKQAAGILRSAVQEMERRYDLLDRTNTRNIESYNEKMPKNERLPYIVVV